jgi:hypothetical protein
MKKVLSLYTGSGRPVVEYRFNTQIQAELDRPLQRFATKRILISGELGKRIPGV